MFSQAISVLALIPVLLHSILGCCWHHEHAPEESAVGSYVWAAAAETCDHEHQHNSGAPCGDGGVGKSGESEEHRDPHAPCREKLCLLAVTVVSVPPESVVPEADKSLNITAMTAPGCDVWQSNTRQTSISERVLPSSSQRRALRQVWRV